MEAKQPDLPMEGRTTPIRELQGDTSTPKKRIMGESWARRPERPETTEEWKAGRTWEEPLAPKEQKKFALDKIADVKKGPFADKGGPGHILIDIPGDGEFYIVNTPDALALVEKNFKKDFPVQPARPSPSPTYPSSKPTSKRTAIDKMDDLTYVSDYKPRTPEVPTSETQYYSDGIYSNGHVIIKTEKPKISTEPFKQKHGPAKILKEMSDNAKTEAVLEKEFKPSYGGAVGIIEAGDTRVMAKAGYLDYIVDQYPKATPFISAENGPVVFKENSKPVAAVMPMQAGAHDWENFDSFKASETPVEEAAPLEITAEIEGKKIEPVKTEKKISKVKTEAEPTEEIDMKFGEHIGGSKFDRAHGILTAEDLKGMTDREAQALVKKDNIWRKPDYAAMVEEGAQPHVAWLVKTMRDALPTAPTRPNLREIFIDEVGRVRDILSKLKSEDDFKDLFAAVFGPSLYEKTGMRGMGWTDEGREVAKALGNKFIKALQVSSWDITEAKRTVAEKEWPFAKGTGGGGERQKMPERPLLENIKRTGEDYRGGKNITPAEFQKTFGFRGGEFGKWLNQADRQDSLNFAYDAFMDLANILGVPPKAISLEGELGFAFGARGSGRHAAHYEPAKIVINLTKTKGAGATAHEWAHALDDYFGRLSGKTKLGTYASHGMTPGGVREEMRQAWKAVSDAMTYRYETYNEAVKSAADQLAQSVKYTESWLGGIRRGLTEENKPRLDALTPKILEGDTGALKELFTFSKPDKTTKQGLMTNFDFLRRRMQRVEDLGAGKEAYNKVKTDFYREAKNLDAKKSKKYWSEHHEMFARAFETYVESKVEDAGVKSQYLVHSTYSYNKGYKEATGYSPYPLDAERAVINKAFDNMFEVMETAPSETKDGATRLYRPKSLTSPTFFSKLEQVAGDKLPGKGPASQMADTLESWAKKGLFKPDELKWSGIIPYLREHGGTVTRQDVLDYLKGNQVEVRVVEKGEGLTESQKQEIERLKEKAKSLGDEWRTTNDPVRRDELGAQVNDITSKISRIEKQEKPTKFKDYMRLPAGLTNYREVLLTLPPTIEKIRSEKLSDNGYEPFQYSNSSGTWGLRKEVDGEMRHIGSFESREEALNYSVGPEKETKIYKEAFRVSGVHAYGDPAADVNRFAHMFLSDAEINGKKYLVVTELQSDWSALGRKEGYREPLEIREYKIASEEEAEISGRPVGTKMFMALDSDGNLWASGNNREHVEQTGTSLYNAKKPPPFPFPKTWHEVALKKALRMAADQGYDGLAVVNGDMVKERYDISKQVDAIHAKKNDDGTWDLKADTPDGLVSPPEMQKVSSEKLADIIGKDLAEKIVAESGTPMTPHGLESVWPGAPRGLSQIKNYRVYTGEDLKVGGEWANRFYDQTVPQFLGKYGKQWGARVGEGELPTNKFDRAEYVGPTPNRAEIDALMAYNSPLTASTRLQLKKVRQYLEEGKSFKDAMEYHGSPALAEEFGGKLELINRGETLHTLPFTPAMLAGVKQPQPMFKPKETGDGKEAGGRQTDIQRGTKAGNAYHPENDPEAGRQLRDIKSLIARTDSPETWEHWKDIKDATDKPANAGVIDKLAAKHGLPVVWVKDANFAGAVLDTKDGRVILLDEEATDVPYLSIARHEIFHHLVKNFDQDAYNLIGLVDTESPAFQRYAKSYREAMGATTASLDDFQVAEELSADWYSGVKEISGITLKDAFGKNKGKAFKTREQMMTRPSYKPRKMPPADEDEPPEKPTGIKNAVTEAEREAKGMGPVEVPLRMRRGFEEVLAKGKKIVDSGTIDPRFLAEQLTIKPRALSPEETAVLDYDRMRLQNHHLALMNKIDKSKDPADILELRLRLAKIEDDLQTNDVAARLTGYEQGLGLGIRRMMIAEDYSLARTILRVRAATGLKEIPEELREKLEILTKQLQEAIEKSDEFEKKVAELEKIVSKRRTEGKVREQVARHQASREPKTKLDNEFQDLRKAFLAKVSQISMNLDPAAVKILGEMAINRVKAGLRDAEQIVSEIYDELNSDVPDLEIRDVRDAISGYGISGKMSQDEIKVAIREAKRQMRLISAVEDAQEGQIPLRSGLQRDPVSDKVRDLQKKVRQAMRVAGIDSNSIRSPEEQWRTALEAVKTRLRNQIHDLNDQLATGKKTPKKIGIKYDKEAEELKAERDRLKEILVGIEGKTEMSPEQRVKIAVDAVERSIKEYERRIKDKDLAPRPKVSKTPLTPELKFLRGRRQILSDAFKQMVRDARPSPDPAAVALKAYKTRMNKRIETLRDMLATGNYEKRARLVLKMDPEAMRLKNEVNKFKERIDREVFKQKQANRTKLQKALDYSVKWRRAIILSGVGTIVKLTNAATMRAFTTPLEEMVGMVVTRLPYISGIAAKSPRHSTGINLRAEAAAFRQWFEKQTFADMVDTIKTGRGSLDRLYGKKSDLPPEALDFFGHIHGALKTTPKRAEFYRSLQKRTEWAMKNGYDMTDPVTQMTIATAAYVDANRAIFLQNNAVVTAYRMVIGYLKNHSTAGRGAATVLQFLLPIVKIPTNFVAETGNYALGAVNAIAKIIGAGGKEKVGPEEADTIIRSLNKQAIGLFALLLGFLGYEAIGGYYQAGEKRKAKDVRAGGLRIGGVNVPHLMLHTPLLEVLQLGSTIRRTIESYAEYNRKHAPEDQKSNPLFAAGVATTIGALKQVPFFETPMRLGQETRSAETFRHWLNQMGSSLVVPPDVRRLARYQDTAGEDVIPRDEKTLTGTIKSNIPWLRQGEKIDIARMKKWDLGRLSEAVNKAPEGVLKDRDAATLLDALDKKWDRVQEKQTDEEKKTILDAIHKLIAAKGKSIPWPTPQERTIMFQNRQRGRVN